MKRTRILSFVLAMLMALSLFPGIVSAADNALPVIKSDDIVILYTNDVHCGVGQVTDGEGNVTNIGYGGLAAFKKYAQSKTGSGMVTLVDAGDAVQGDALGTMSKGQYIVEIMNKVGYDIFVPGNHDFDYGMERMLELTGMMKAQVISANFMDLKTAKPVFAPYTIVAYGAKKVAYIGITTPESFTKSTPAYFQDSSGQYIYGLSEKNNGADLYKAVQGAVDAALAQGADYVIAVGHLGIDEQSAPWRSTDVIAYTRGIDAFIDGHSHSTIASRDVPDKDGNTVILTQTGTKLSNIGCMTISADGTIKAGLVSGYSQQDSDAGAFVNGILSSLEEDLAEVVAVTSVDLTVNDPLTGNRMVRSRETNLGDLAADAYRFVLGNGKTGDGKAPADIALVNGGGVRADIAAGEVTFGEIIAVHPFNNSGCVVEATGREILDALEMASRYAPAENGGFLQASGISYTIDTAIASSVKTDDKGNFVSVEGRRRIKKVTVGGASIDENKTYTLASHNYLLLDGGDGINMFRDNKVVVQPVMLDNQVLITYMDEYLGGVAGSDYANPYGQGRIIVKSASSFAGLGSGVMDGEEILRYSAGLYDAEGGVTEIVAYSQFSQTAYVVNGRAGLISGLDLSAARVGSLANIGGANIDVRALVEKDGFVYGDVTSIAVSPDGTTLAAAIQHAGYDQRGRAVAFTVNSDGSLKIAGSFETGVQPDMIVFADNDTILTADEGEPRMGYDGAVDPRGSITVIRLSAGSAQIADFTSYDAKRSELVRAGVVMKKGAAPSVDFEPEYIAVSNGNAYVTLQENNAIAVLDIAAVAFTGVYSLGVQDHARVAIDLDNSADNDGGAYSPRYYDDTFGLRMPDGIAAYQASGKTYIITANEGDSRDWPGYLNEAEKRITATDGSETTKKVRFLSEDYEGQPGLADGGANYLFGSRSFSVFEISGKGLTLVYDSGPDFEGLTAQFLPEYFNCSNDDAAKDSRSNKKGPEPESIAIGTVTGKTYAFVTLERIGGIMAYDVTKPTAISYAGYLNSRDYDTFFNDNEDGIGFDDSAEGLAFIPAANSPTGSAILLAAFEVSGNVAAYSLGPVFSDISHLKQDQQEDIKRASALRLVAGVGGGRFAPDVEATAQQAATVFLGVLGKSATYETAIETAASIGLMEAGTAKNQRMTYTGFAKLIAGALRISGADVATSLEGDNIALCVSLGFFPRESGSMPDTALTRADMVRLAMRWKDAM
jgi:2',3'-cyclic-nucleotide 2'-phosphodiesterase (5'-nucleotidase family)